MKHFIFESLVSEFTTLSPSQIITSKNYVIYMVCLLNHFISLKLSYIQHVIGFIQSPTSSAGKDSTIIGKCQTWSVSAWSMGLSAVELRMYLFTKQPKHYKINYNYKLNKWDKYNFVAFSALCCYSLFWTETPAFLRGTIAKYFQQTFKNVIFVSEYTFITRAWMQNPNSS